MLASAIKMGEEDRMALMIMVKQGELTVEEAVEQLKRLGVKMLEPFCLLV